ncbi:zinc finger MYM-type protein 1-like [Tachypleus tridentatus]|uniref:zinc finger MYM-type protein 1-like n=1 Tax=Tachypleus tridentatus TaxID=6853 RepID=UPI003FCF1B35
MQHYLLPNKKQRVDGPTNTCGASEEDSCDRYGENVDTTSARPNRKMAPLTPRKTKGARIQHALNASHAETVKENRHYIRATIDALLYIACQNEAQRGHREGSQSDNRANFLELLDMISRYDEIVKKKLSGPGNAKYTHHDIQNELLDIIAGMIRKDISKEVMEAEHFALMVVETKDVKKQEQLSILVKYLHQQSLHEKFLDFTAAEGLDADLLLKKIMETLAKCGIDHNACIGQCYDAAAVMSGHISGVQERFRREVSQAVYVHCYAHRLNLVLVDQFLKVQKELEPVNQHIELKRLSDTRWACKRAAYLAVKRNLPAIVTTLKRLVEGDNVHRATELKGLCILQDQQFVASLVAIEKLLLMKKQLSVCLQSPDLQQASAEDLDKGQEVSTPLELATMLEPYKDTFMYLHKLVCIALTLPVTSAACERSFSCLKLLKIYLRNSSGNNRTSNLAIISVNSRRAKQLDIDTVIDTFAANHQNRRIVLK